MTQSAAVNFLPEDYVEKRAQDRSNLICIGLFVAVMAGVVIAYIFSRGDAVYAQRDRVNMQYEEASKKLAELQELEQQRQHMLDKAEVTAMLLERVPRSVLMDNLVRLMPKGVSLLSLDLQTHDLPAASAKSKFDAAQQAMHGDQHGAIQRPNPTQVTVTLTGVAPTDGDIANFITALDKSELLQDVNHEFSEEYKLGDETLRRFRVAMVINPNYDGRAKAGDSPPVNSR